MHSARHLSPLASFWCAARSSTYGSVVRDCHIRQVSCEAQRTGRGLFGEQCGGAVELATHADASAILEEAQLIQLHMESQDQAIGALLDKIKKLEGFKAGDWSNPALWVNPGCLLTPSPTTLGARRPAVG